MNMGKEVESSFVLILLHAQYWHRFQIPQRSNEHVETHFLEAQLKAATRESNSRRDGVAFVKSPEAVSSGNAILGKTTS
jgi:hypothetical protein